MKVHCQLNETDANFQQYKRQLLANSAESTMLQPELPIGMVSEWPAGDSQGRRRGSAKFVLAMVQEAVRIASQQRQRSMAVSGMRMSDVSRSSVISERHKGRTPESTIRDMELAVAHNHEMLKNLRRGYDSITGDGRVKELAKKETDRAEQRVLEMERSMIKLKQSLQQRAQRPKRSL